MKIFHFISDKYALDVIAHQRIKVSKLDDLNDPFELHAVDLSDKKYRKKFRKFKQGIADRTGILCFSQSWKSPLLWSHYANRHKGVAFEFEVSDELAHPITYKKNRFIIDIEAPRTLPGVFNKKELKGIWFTKYEQWYYEEEIRVVLVNHEFYKENGIYFHDLERDVHLKGIILGPLCDISISEIENCLPRDVRISVTKSRLAFSSFRVVRDNAFKTRNLVGKVESTTLKLD